MPDDAALLRRYAQDRAEDAFAELVRRHVDGVYSAALRRVGGDTHLAEDVTQQVFVALARKAASLSRHPVLTGWLYLTTRHESANVVRREQRRKAREQEAHAMNETVSDSGPSADWSRVAPVLDEAIDQLNEADRTAILLRFIDRRGFAEIGTTLKLTEDAARMKVDRSLEKVRTTLARRGITSTSAALCLALANHAVAAAPVGLGAIVTTAALSSAPAIAAPLVGFLQFMSASKIAGSSAALVVALLVASTVQEVQVARANTTALTVSVERNKALSLELDALRQRAAAMNRTAALLERKRRDTLATQSAHRLQRFVEVNAAKFAEDAAFMARHPEVHRLAIEHARNAVGGRFAYLLKKLRLAPAQIERFMDLQLQIQVFATGGGPFVKFGGNPEEARRELQALLGEEGFLDYEKILEPGDPYVRTIVPAQLTAQMTASLFDSPTPLTTAQGEKLWDVLTAGRVLTEWSELRQYDWAAVLPKAREFLSDEQFNVLKCYQATDEFNQAMSRARFDSDKAASGLIPPGSSSK